MPDKIIETIKKLFSLAASDNEAEAAAAAGKAHELLRAHNLSLSDLERGHSARVDKREYLRGTKIESWKQTLLDAIAQSNYCRVIWYTYNLKKRRGRRKRALNERAWCIVGREHNAAACEVMADYLFSAVERFSERWRAGNRGRLTAYQLGIVTTLSQRLEELRRKDYEDAEGRNLILCEDALLAQFMARVRLVSTRTASVSDLDAYGQGREDGGEISLAAQLGARGKPATRPLLTGR